MKMLAVNYSDAWINPLSYFLGPVLHILSILCPQALIREGANACSLPMRLHPYEPSSKKIATQYL